MQQEWMEKFINFHSIEQEIQQDAKQMKCRVRRPHIIVDIVPYKNLFYD